MTEENCEEKCCWFKALQFKDESLARFNREAREAAQKVEEFDGSVGSMCGSCVKLKRNGDDLTRMQNESLISK